MILLILVFLKIGILSYGGGLVVIKLLEDISLQYNWFTEEMFVNMIAVSQSTPGPIAINMATIVGTNLYGFPGALVASFSVILPGFILCLLLAKFLEKNKDNKNIDAVQKGIKSIAIGLICSGVYSLFKIVIINDDASGLKDIVNPLDSILLIIFIFILVKLKVKAPLVILFGGISYILIQTFFI